MNLQSLVYFGWAIGGAVFIAGLTLLLRRNYSKSPPAYDTAYKNDWEFLKPLFPYACIILPVCIFLVVFIPGIS